VFQVAAFVEKPDLATARRYVADGYCGTAATSPSTAATLLGELAAFEPAMARARPGGRRRAWSSGACGWTGSLRRAAKKSLDYAVMERTTRAAVVPAAFTWSDLGAWDAIWEASIRDAEGNAASGDVHLINTKGVLARSTGPFVGAIGVRTC
jgi:mannose-1-phosphate guanylyltransferase